MKGVQADYYFGTIVNVPDTSNSFEVQVNIPGVMENLTCFPLRCGSDEQVLLLCIPCQKILPQSWPIR